MTNVFFRSLILAALALSTMALAPVAMAETRTLDIYFTHTKERKKITFKKNGKYVKSGLRKLNRILRDHRRKEATRMDPKLLDLVWEIYKEAGGKKPIHVISAYRSPKTNAMLRRRGRKTARKSQHMRGKALDWFIPGISVAKLHKVAMRRHGGGVGHYRNSFIHTDTARVRHWPRMSRRQLARIFPKGRTIHVPSNGRPLRGYKVALANLKKGLRADGRRPRYKSDGKSRTLLARIFRKDDGTDSKDDEIEAPVPAAKPERKPAAPAAKPEAPTPTVVAARGTDLFAADAKRALTKPTRIARATVPAARPAPAATLVAAVDPARPARRPGADLAGTPTPLDTFSLAELNQRRAAGAAATAYASPDVADRGAQAVEALAAGRPAVPAAAEPRILPAALPAPKPAGTQVALAEPAPRPDLDALNRRIRSSFERPRERKGTLEDRLAAIQPAPLRRPRAPLIDEKQAGEPIITAATAPNPTAPIVEAVKQRLPGVARTLRQRRQGGVTFVRLSESMPAVPFAIGNLYGRSVKSWATARTTRRGLFAALRAPHYKHSTRLPAPGAVYGVGFSKQPRQRTDAFTGSSMLQVDYQELAQLTR